MAKVNGLDNVVSKLLARIVQKPKVRVAVGYTKDYALRVHELTGMVMKGIPRDPRKRAGVKHRKPSMFSFLGGSIPIPRKAVHKGRFWDPQDIAMAKFLERPFKLRRDEILRIIKEAYQKGKTLAESLLLGGLFLQRESQKIVPVEFGELKKSAFTREV